MLNFKEYVILEERLNEMRRFPGLVKYNPLFESVKMPGELERFFKDVGIDEDDIKFDEIKPNEGNKKLISYKNENENHFQDMKIGKFILQVKPNLSKVDVERLVAKYKDGVQNGNFNENYKFEMKTPVSKYFNEECRSDDKTKSCMVGKTQLTSFYDNEVGSDIVQMLVLYKDGKPIGSALIWLKDLGLDKPFVDRVYPTSSQGIVSRFNEYCKQQGWYYRHDNSLGSSNKGFGNIALEIPNYNTNQKVPYMDTLSWGHYDYSKNILYMNNHGNHVGENTQTYQDSIGYTVISVKENALTIRLNLKRLISSGDFDSAYDILDSVDGEHIDMTKMLKEGIDEPEYFDKLLQFIKDRLPYAEIIDNGILTRDVRIVDAILKKGFNIEGRYLAYSIENGDIDIIKSILNYTGKLERSDLLDAFESNNQEILDFVITKCDDLNAAIRTRDLKVVSAVLKNGNKLKTDDNTLDFAKRTWVPEILNLVQRYMGK